MRPHVFLEIWIISYLNSRGLKCIFSSAISQRRFLSNTKTKRPKLSPFVKCNLYVRNVSLIHVCSFHLEYFFEPSEKRRKRTWLELTRENVRASEQTGTDVKPNTKQSAAVTRWRETRSHYQNRTYQLRAADASSRGTWASWHLPDRRRHRMQEMVYNYWPSPAEAHQLLGNIPSYFTSSWCI